MRLTKQSIFALILALLHGVTECVVLNIKGLGSVIGSTKVLNNSTVDTFLGVPFAKPPVGDLRFAPPQMVEPWNKVLNGTKRRCLQFDTTSRKVLGQEDCLYLNVYRPGSAAVSQKNVMVFIHGGAYKTGSGYQHNGEVLAALNDVVVVTINYRLGILGFYSMPDSELTGNYGLQDQILALKWVKAHISDFGGDPSKVTIFGESAGASSVTLLLLSPLAKGLFTRAIAQSGAALNIWAVFEKQNATIASKFAARAGCQDQNITTCLRGKSALLLLARQVTSRAIELISPTVDGKVITSLPFAQSSMGRLPVSDVELMIGFNKDDGSMFVPSMTWTKSTYKMAIGANLRPRFKDQTALVAEISSFQYERFTKPENRSLILSYTDFLNDIYFKETIVRMASDWARAGKRVYLYDFTYRPRHLLVPAWGVAHTLDLVFVFGRAVYSIPDWLINSYTQADSDVSLRMMKMWTDFAKTGVPHSKWPVYGLADKSYLEINVNDTVRQDFSPKRMAFWHSTVPNVIALAKAQTKMPTSTPQTCTTQKTKSAASKNSAYTYGLAIMTALACFFFY